MESTNSPADPAATCCTPAITPASRAPQQSSCPLCGKHGKAVAVVTVRALLAISLQAVTDDDYRFCATSDCPVVYFSRDGTQQFTTAQLREPVFQKAPATPTVPVCYCFHYTLGVIQEADTSTRAQIVAAITAGVQAGQCACDIRNPQGKCCLGNVRHVTQMPIGAPSA